MNEWKEYKLKDVANVKYGKAHQSLSDGYIPAYGSGGLIRYVEKALYNEESILIPRKGTLNNIIYKDEPFWTVDTMFWTELNKKIIVPKYLFYQLSLIDFSNMNVGSAVPSMTIPILNDIDIYVPSIPAQTAISSILSSLDDKIDLLHRQNATLEKLAETLFRQWFVEEAKEEWETKPLSSIAYFLNGLACQKYPPKNDLEKLPVIKIKELSSGITENSDWATTDVKPEYIVKNGDVIFAWSASLMVKIWDGQDCILNQHLFKVTSENYPKWFYFLWCKHYLDEFIAKAASHATTMGHIKRGDLDDAMVLIPSTKELEEMTFETEPLIAKIISNNRQLRLLVNLRDTLLPKLMSGEIRVKIN